MKRADGHLKFPIGNRVNLDKIYKEVGEKFNINPKIIKRIINLEGYFIKDSLEAGKEYAFSNILRFVRKKSKEKWLFGIRLQTSGN